MRVFKCLQYALSMLPCTSLRRLKDALSVLPYALLSRESRSHISFYVALSFAYRYEWFCLLGLWVVAGGNQRLWAWPYSRRRGGDTIYFSFTLSFCLQLLPKGLMAPPFLATLSISQPASGRRLRCPRILFVQCPTSCVLLPSYFKAPFCCCWRCKLWCLVLRHSWSVLATCAPF